MHGLFRPVAPLLLGALLAGGSLYQIREAGRDLPGRIMQHGRVVLSSPGFDDGAEPGLLVDGRTDTAAVLRFPAPPPEGAFLLSDLALTHFPGPTGDPDRPLRPRRALALRLFNGACVDCSEQEFRRYGRIKRARLEILQRRANDPDVEFIIPPVRLLRSVELDFPDRPGPVEIPLELPDPDPAPAYPANVFYIICKLTVLEQFPGRKFPDRVAVAELIYVDSDLEAALQGEGRPFPWK